MEKNEENWFCINMKHYHLDETFYYRTSNLIKAVSDIKNRVSVAGTFWRIYLCISAMFDLDLDSLHDLGDSMEQSQQRQRLAQQRHHLVFSLRQPVVQQHFSSKYPTKSGKLQLPFMIG